MIELIAIHVGGALPVVLEYETEGLNFVHKHALARMPRSPSGVPIVRGLGKADGEVQFKFKVAPDKVSAAGVPELLALWDGKFTEATLKLMAKKTKAEREAATAAGLWKEGAIKGDLTAMHQGCSPAEAKVFDEALAQVQGKSKAKLAGGKNGTGKRTPKPKLLNAVIDATTTLDPLTGERVQNLGAADSAVTMLRAQEVVAGVLAKVSAATAAAGDRQEFADPLEEARQSVPVSKQAQETTELAKTPVGELTDELDVATPNQPSPAQTEKPAATEQPAATVRAKKAVLAHRKGLVKGPRLVAMSAQDLFRHLEQDTPGVFKNKQTQPDLTCDTELNSDQSKGECPPQDGDGFAGYTMQPEDSRVQDFDPFLEFEAMEQPDGQTQPVGDVLPDTARFDAAPTEQTACLDSLVVESSIEATGKPDQVVFDWTGLVSFRMDNHRSDAHAVLLDTGEVFEALAYLQVGEPLEVKAEWLTDAARLAEDVPKDANAFAEACKWLCAELDWRSQELVRWLGKTDLVTSPPADGADAFCTSTEKAQRIIKAKKRPPGWVATGCAFALLAQNISLDIAMLEMLVRDIDRALTGMPDWAIAAMQSMREFAGVEAQLLPAVSRSRPGAVFRDVWREEVQRIDRWAEGFSRIKIARQIGLFGSVADQKLLVRLEQVVERTRQWRAAPAQASRVLAVWLAFVLSLDHANRPQSTGIQPDIQPADGLVQKSESSVSINATCKSLEACHA